MADGSLTSDGAGLGPDFHVTIPGPVAPGGYLLVVVEGPAQVKASALAGAIRPGDLLASAAAAGYAARAVDALAGAIETLLGDDALRQRLGQAARETILREFTLERELEGYLAVYRGLRAGPGA